MRIIVYGAGAIGGVLGAALLDAGHDVTFIARGAHLAAIQRDGLTVHSPDGIRTYRVHAVADPSQVDWRAGDAVLLTMKSMDTEAALLELDGRIDPASPIVCVQNGVGNERAALRRFANVFGVCVMFPTAHLRPGEVVAFSAPVPGILDLGRYPAGDPPQELIAALRSAGFVSEPRPDIMRWKYAKLLRNLANAIEALCGRVDGIDEPARLVRDEAETVLKAAGIAFASADEDTGRRGSLLQIKPVDGQPRGGGSSWQSLTRGTGSIEADHLNGEIVLLGRLHGVPTPANELARRLVNQAARDRIPPGSLTPQAFLAQLPK